MAFGTVNVPGYSEENAQGTQTGAIIYWPGEEPPEGYLACNGAIVSRSAYPALFEVLGTRYGEGDGSTTFGLPNLMDGGDL